MQLILWCKTMLEEGKEVVVQYQDEDDMPQIGTCTGFDLKLGYHIDGNFYDDSHSVFPVSFFVPEVGELTFVTPTGNADPIVVRTLSIKYPRVTYAWGNGKIGEEDIEKFSPFCISDVGKDISIVNKKSSLPLKKDLKEDSIVDNILEDRKGLN